MLSYKIKIQLQKLTPAQTSSRAKNRKQTEWSVENLNIWTES